MTNRVVDAKTKRTVQSNERYLAPDLVYDLQNRLHCLEGHIRGIERMLDEQAACEELLIQTSAVRAALNQINIKIIEGQMRTCIEKINAPIAFEKFRGALTQVLKNG